MRYRFILILPLMLTAGLVALTPPLAPAQARTEPDDVPQGVEVQARGAVHEAYGEPVRSQAVPGPIVRQEPPRQIDEAPPEEKPEGDNIVWIPGYWSWDEDSGKHLWISGFWRAVPPGRNWIPGTWQRVAGGFRWVSGYWGVASQGEETEYLPAPPESIDNGPSVPAPGENYSYVPGCWVYQSTRYVWRPGYWLSYRPGWVWVPSCYRWTPCGYVFVPGYWDLPLLDRGMLFAPVAFSSPVYLNPGFVYTPSYCIQPDFLCGALFVRRGWGGYYFGDYFGSPYRSSFVAWTSFRFGRGVGIDLNFGYYRSAFRGYPAWERGLNGLYAGRFAGTIAPPPRTLIQQKQVINNIVVNKTTNNIVNKNINITNIQNATALTSVRNVKKVNTGPMASLAGISGGKPAPAGVGREIRVERVNPNRLREERQQINRMNTLARERRSTEERLATRAAATPDAKPIKARYELPKGTPPARVVKTPTPPPPAKTDTRVSTSPSTPSKRPEVNKPRPESPNRPEVKPQPTRPTRPEGNPGTAKPDRKPEVKPMPTRPTRPETPRPEIKPVQPRPTKSDPKPEAKPAPASPPIRTQPMRSTPPARPMPTPPHPPRPVVTRESAQPGRPIPESSFSTRTPASTGRYAPRPSSSRVNSSMPGTDRSGRRNRSDR